MSTFQPPDFYQLDDLITSAERDLRDHVRAWVDERFLPIVAQHYRDGSFPMELIPEMAHLGLFGPGIKGYGCAGLGSVAVGLMMQELERGDSGLRTFASVQGSLGMTAIDLFGSEEQKQRWLPALAAGEKLGCFALTEPEAGSNPASLSCFAKETSNG
ncbi:MAG TPA: acyl-CoA dehydrogenase family protein, partial [Chthoniobacterales bacterium]|nr:acyl-CoA dehydrogenase family protein [Chthoniobacterales bacterium]